MFCAISGVPPKIPVVSPKSGHLFEFDIINQYINEHHKDPINSEPLEASDLIYIRNSETSFQPPRQATINSIPSLLSSLQNEWDSVALELFSLRQQLEDTRKELSSALYHHDSAVRVASKAIKERDEARKALQELSISISSGDDVNNGAISNTNTDDIEVSDSSVPQYISDLITTANDELFQLHKATKNKVNVAVSHEFSIEEQSGSSKPFKKIVQASETSTGFVFSSVSGISAVYDSTKETSVKDDSILKDKHISKISISDHKIVGLSDGKLYLDKTQLQTNHKSEIIDILQHPSLSNIVVSIDRSGLFSIIDTEKNAVVYNNQVSDDINTADIHGDGALIAIGNSTGEIYVIDLRNGEVLTTLKNSDSKILKLKFGNNGYWLFSTTEDSSLSIWDLRKNTSSKVSTSTNINSFTLDKSANIFIGINQSNQLELVQYNKSTKSWFIKGKYDIKNDNTHIMSAIVVDDNTKDTLVLDVLESSSSVKRITLS